MLDVLPDADVEFDRAPCQCQPGHICPDGDPFSALCPRRSSAPPADWLVARPGPEDTWSYVRKLLPEVGAAVWTDDRAAALRFHHHSAASYIQRCIVARDGVRPVLEAVPAVLADTAEV